MSSPGQGFFNGMTPQMMAMLMQQHAQGAGGPPPMQGGIGMPPGGMPPQMPPAPMGGPQIQVQPHPMQGGQVLQPPPAAPPVPGDPLAGQTDGANPNPFSSPMGGGGMDLQGLVKMIQNPGGRADGINPVAVTPQAGSGIGGIASYLMQLLGGAR